MTISESPGQIIILNGTPRSGKSSIALEIQNTFEGLWMNIGVDRNMEMTPERFRPGIGLRPGGERPDLEPLIMLMYKGMYESIAIHSRLGINIVVDVGHHDSYSVPLGILPKCAQILNGLPVLFIGVRCPLEVIMERRINTWNSGYAKDGSVPLPVRKWQKAVHEPGIYDLEVDTSQLSVAECANKIQHRLKDGKPLTAFQIIKGIR